MNLTTFVITSRDIFLNNKVVDFLDDVWKIPKHFLNYFAIVPIMEHRNFASRIAQKGNSHAAPKVQNQLRHWFMLLWSAARVR